VLLPGLPPEPAEWCVFQDRGASVSELR
jgi:hypothetical protein